MWGINVRRWLMALLPLAVAPVLGGCPAPAVPRPTQEGVYSNTGPVRATLVRMGSVVEFVDAYGRPTRTLPPDLDPVLRDVGNVENDGWGRAFRYVPRGLRFDVRSAGLDGEFDTRDDIVVLGQLGRNVACEVRVAGVVRRTDSWPPCTPDAEIVIIPLCPQLVPPGLAVETTPSSTRDSVLLTGRRLVRFARSVDRSGRERGALPPSMRFVTGYPRVGNGWELADAWGRAVRYQPRGGNFEMRSAGSDALLDTPDDIVLSAQLGHDIPCEFTTEQGVARCGDAPPRCPSATP